MKKLFLSILFILVSLPFMQAQKAARTEVYKAKDGKMITLHLYGHASMAIEADGNMIYIDPVAGMADYTHENKADNVFVTHSHGDHFDMKTIKSISTPKTHIYCDMTTAKEIKDDKVFATTVRPGNLITLANGTKVEVIPAYNYTAGHTNFHPKKNDNCGYLFNIGKTRIYVAGDSENTPEMKALKDIDIAFLPVNQPYTMTVDQAVDAVKAIRPKLFYPYHYGKVKEVTDMTLLESKVKPYTTIKIKGME